MPYKDEGEFSRALVDKLKERFHVTRFETRTRAGVPDILASCVKGVRWIETKVVRKNYYTINEKIVQPVKVKFEPGQQYFALEWLKAVGYPVHYLIAFNDSIQWLPFKKLYVNDMIPKYDMIAIGTSYLVTSISQFDFLFD